MKLRIILFICLGVVMVLSKITNIDTAFSVLLGYIIGLLIASNYFYNKYEKNG